MAWLVILSGYFLGCIPTACMAGRLTGRGDIRKLGDGNPGADNVFRQLGPGTGIAVGLIDAAKGAAAVLIARAVGLPQTTVMLTGIAVVMGHDFPIFFGFRGGEGMACSLGILTALMPEPMLILATPTIVTLVVCRNTDPALAVLFIPLAPLCLILKEPIPLAIYSLVLPCLVAVTHYGRLFARKARVIAG